MLLFGSIIYHLPDTLSTLHREQNKVKVGITNCLDSFRVRNNVQLCEEIDNKVKEIQGRY